nr:hypothetical protein CFP56_21931 [Quercus suber]
MLQWRGKVARLSWGSHRSLLPCSRYQPRCHQRQVATTTPEAKRAWFAKTFPVLDQLGFPPQRQYRKGASKSWMRHIEGALPVHLRHDSSQTGDEACLTPIDTAGVLLAAHKLAVLNEHPAALPVLSYLGVVEQRWDAVIWLIKYVIEGTDAVVPSREPPPGPLWPWLNQGSMRSITEQAFAIDPPDVDSDLPLLDTLTSTLKSDEAPSRAIIRKDFIGLLWYSLAEMILACDDGVIRPEVLEIIAYLHHCELMPMSIYAQKPPATTMAIQQPPLLHLLSSQILKSLSDAAWKAQERLIMKDAEARGKYYRAIPPSAYRVHVEGLRPEIWLELVLWSCLQGEWLSDGLLILYRTCVHQGHWASLPWGALIPSGQDSRVTVNRFLDISPDKSTDRAGYTYAQVRRTISNEVVNAYIDALMSAMPETEPYIDTLVTSHAPRLLSRFKMFMERSNSKLNAGLWDTVVSRCHGSTNAWLANSALPIPTALVETSNPSPRVSQLVEDERFLAVGLYHNALRQTVEQENLEGSFQLIKQLKTYILGSTTTDRKPLAEGTESRDPITSLPKTTYSQENTKHQILETDVPITILAPLLELIMDSRAYDLGHNLLDERSPYTYIVTSDMYGDPGLSGSLARFAAETADRTLFSKVISSSTLYRQKEDPEATQLPEHLSRAFLNTQINLRRWSAAMKLLEFMQDLKYDVDADTLASIGRVMLKAQSNHNERDLEQAKQMFSAIVGDREDRGRHHSRSLGLRTEPRIEADFREERNKQTLLLTIIASLDPYWAAFSTGCRELSGFRTFTLRTRTFNLIFEGIIGAFGSNVGRRVLEQFWPRSLRTLDSETGREARSTVFEQSHSIDGARHRLVRARTAIPFPGHPDHRVVIYGGLEPNVMTFDLLFRQLLIEMSSRPKSAGSSRIPHGSDHDVAIPEGSGDPSQPNSNLENSDIATLIWVVRCLQHVGSGDEYIRKQLSAAFQEHDMQDVQKLFPHLFDPGHDDGSDDNDTASWLR